MLNTFLFQELEDQKMTKETPEVRSDKKKKKKRKKERNREK